MQNYSIRLRRPYQKSLYMKRLMTIFLITLAYNSYKSMKQLEQYSEMFLHITISTCFLLW